MKSLFTSLFLIICYLAQAQHISIEECYKQAEKNYPLIRQLNIIEQNGQLNIENIAKSNLPQISFNGNASYQSEVTSLPIKLPMVTIPEISKDQYRLYAEISQPLLEWRNVSKTQEWNKLNTASELAKYQVEIYKLREKINQLFFGILLSQEQIKSTELMKMDMDSLIQKNTMRLKSGTFSSNQLEILIAEKIRIKQKIQELKSSYISGVQMLSVLTGNSINENSIFDLPQAIAETNVNKRPELQLYELQKNTLLKQCEVLNAKNYPKLNLYFQGGYGRPTLNMLSNDFNSYYITGIRLNWNFSSLYTLNKEKKIIRNSSELSDVQKDIFMLNNEIGIRQIQNEKNRLDQLIEDDETLIQIRKKIRLSTAEQVNQGTNTNLDYVRDLNAEAQAVLNANLHKIQRIYINYQLTNSRGNYEK